MNARHLITLILITALILPVLAVPTAPTVSLISGANFTATSTGASGTCFFRWGTNQQTPEFKTPNQTTSGTCTYRQYGGAYFPLTAYVIQACDGSGCSSNTAFTSTANTPSPATTFSATFNNLTDNNYDIMMVITALPSPYLMVFPANTVSTGFGFLMICALFISFYFVSIWARQRKVSIAAIIGMLVIGFLVNPLNGMNWGMPQEFVTLGQCFCYVAIGGMVFAWWKKG
jgi:hypothetical protein